MTRILGLNPVVKPVTTPCFKGLADLDYKVSGVYRTAARDVVIGAVRVNAGDRVFASLSKANVDVSDVLRDDCFYSQHF